MPVLELAREAVMEQGILPQYLNIKFVPHDDCCEPSLATISVMDGLYGDECSHAILGPACDYSTGIFTLLSHCMNTNCSFVYSLNIRLSYLNTRIYVYTHTNVKIKIKLNLF